MKEQYQIRVSCHDHSIEFADSLANQIAKQFGVERNPLTSNGDGGHDFTIDCVGMEHANSICKFAGKKTAVTASMFETW